MAFDPHSLKLGKKPPNFAAIERLPKFEAYVKHDEIVVPSACDWTRGISDWGMLLNNRLGDCVIASAFHQVKAWTHAAGHTDSLGDAQCLADYERFCGYNPDNPATDHGCEIASVIQRWQKEGLGFGHQIVAAVSLEVGNLTSLRQAIYLFGGVTVGIQLPVSAQGQVGSLWTVVPGPNGAAGSWGGHGVPIVRYAPGTVSCVTWGFVQNMTESFYTTYADECWAIVSQDFINIYGTNPVGFRLQQLLDDLRAMG